MTPKEKAIELIKSMYGNIFDGGQYEDAEDAWYNSKQCALIAVDEILEATKTEYQIKYDNGEYSREIGYEFSSYWLDVKKEIEKL